MKKTRLIVQVIASTALAAPCWAQGSPGSAPGQTVRTASIQPAPSAAGSPYASSTEPPLPTPSPAAERSSHNVSVAFSPLHLTLPIVELTGEVRLHKLMSIAAIAGYGSVKLDYSGTPPSGAPDRATVYEIGGQYRFYPIGGFDNGLQLGLEALYIHAGVENATASGVASGFAVGPFAGYKIITPVGFTFDGQLGVEFITGKAQAQNTSGQSASTSGKTTIPLLNLNIGWSF